MSMTSPGQYLSPRERVFLGLPSLGMGIVALLAPQRVAYTLGVSGKYGHAFDAAIGRSA
jgi:hypothetical protein